MNALGTGYTIMMWFEGASPGAWGSIFSLWDSGASTRNVTIQRYSTSGYFRVYHGTSYQNFSDFTTAECAVPQVLAFSHDGDNCRYYKDAVWAGTKSHAADPPSNVANSTLYIGGGTPAIYHVLVWSRKLEEPEIERVTLHPWSPYRVAGPVAVRVVGALGGTGATHALSGSATATSSVSGALSVTKSLAASVAGQTAVTGSLGVSREISGSTAAQASILGGLSVAKSLAGSSTVFSDISAALSVTRFLAGAAAGQSAASGTVRTIRRLAGSISVQTGLSGTLTTQGQITLAGSIAAKTSVSGVVRATRTLAGTTTASSETSAALSVVRPLSGSVAVQSGLTGAVRLSRRLSGSITTTVAAYGAVKVTHGFSGSIVATSTLSGLLQTGTGVTVELAGSITVTAACVAVLRIFRTPTGQAAVLQGMMQADADAVLDCLPAEAAVYTPAGSSGRDVLLMVDRQAAHLEGAPRRKVRPLRVWAKNAVSDGITAGEITKQDTVTIARHIGGPAVAMRVVRRLSQSDGWTELELL